MKIFWVGWTLITYTPSSWVSNSASSPWAPSMPRIRKSKYALSRSATYHNYLPLTQRPANGEQLPAALRSSTRSPRAGKNPERQQRVTPPGNRVRFPTLTLVPHSDGQYFALLEKPKDPGIPNNFPYKDQILAEIAEERRQVRFRVVQIPLK